MKAVSLFSGAGGFDVGFVKEGFDVIWANDFNSEACKTYSLNIGNHIHCGDITELKHDLFVKTKNQNIDVIFGGPPCQGFSRAGKMNADDERSQLIWEYADIIKTVQPNAFIMENVSALGNDEKWADIKNKLLYTFKKAGYIVDFIILKANDFNVPQQRNRVFFMGFKSNLDEIPDLKQMVNIYKNTAPSVGVILKPLGKQLQSNIAQAKIIFAKKQVLSRNPYTSFLVNGGTVGGFINLKGHSPTLTASMGGNLTPIIDTRALYTNKYEWVLDYFILLKQGAYPLNGDVAPGFLRRLSTLEAAAIQTFPNNYIWNGAKSSTYKQIGNAVPCNLAQTLAHVIKQFIINKTIINISQSKIII